MPEVIRNVLIVLAVCLGAVFGLVLIYVIVVAISAALVDTKRVYDKHSRFYRILLNSFTALTKFFVGARMHVSGMDKFNAGISEGTRFLIVQNHRSNFDPILTWYVLCKYDIAFISKEKNMHIPFFGRIIRKCCFMSIDRENAREALKTIIKAGELIKDDQVSVGIYPEGTRNKECRGLLPFHNGVFKIAQMAKVPIVVTTIRGTENIHRNYLRRRTDVYLDITGVIPVETVTSSSTKEIAAEVERQMLKSLEK